MNVNKANLQQLYCCAFNYVNACMLVLGVCFLFMAERTQAQVELKGINTAPNLSGSFNRDSLARDSRFNQPLDLLNDFYPSIEVRLENTSNVQRRTDVRNSDNRLIVNPALAYRTSIGRHGFYAAYTGRFTRHADFTQENVNSNNVSLQLGLDLSKRWDLDLFGDFGNAREERGVSGTRDFFLSVEDGVFVGQGPDRVSYETVGFDLAYGRKLGRLVAVAGYERRTSDFRSEQGGLLEGGDRDRLEESIHFDINYQLSSKTSVFARIENTKTDFTRINDTLDSDETTWLVGLRVNPTSRLSGVVGYGQTERDLEDPSRNGFDGNTYYANITYAITPFSRVEFGAARSVEEPSSSDASFFVSELFSLSWRHELTEKLSLDTFVKTLDDDFENGRRDEFVDWGVSLDYSLRSWLSVGAYYQDIDRDSNVANVEFEDRIFGIRLKSDLRSLLSARRSKKHVEPASFRRSTRTNVSQ